MAGARSGVGSNHELCRHTDDAMLHASSDMGMVAGVRSDNIEGGVGSEHIDCALGVQPKCTSCPKRASTVQTWPKTSVVRRSRQLHGMPQSSRTRLQSNQRCVAEFMVSIIPPCTHHELAFSPISSVRQSSWLASSHPVHITNAPSVLCDAIYSVNW